MFGARPPCCCLLPGRPRVDVVREVGDVHNMNIRIELHDRPGTLAARWPVASLIVLLACQVASAQFASGFEPPTYAGAAGGVDLNGQDGYYNPDPPVSVTALVYVHGNNTLAIPALATGGMQFGAGTGPGDSVFARSQKDITYGGGTGVWYASFDIAVTFTGVLPASQNLGSLSTQPLDVAAPTNSGFIMLATWTDPLTAANWNADFVYFDAANNFTLASVADGGFQTLTVNHWYRWTTKFDFDTNLVTRISITDLTTGVIATNDPVDWYLAGGLIGGLPAPTGFRWFAGATVEPGNAFAFDNVLISCEADLDADGIVGINDFLDLLAAWGPNPGHPADSDLDGTVGINDFLDLLANWGPCG